ncbi:hypothetical protein OG21DRAFT_1496351 [Imleria badia]|nr:hypothetical protein OG21DRAFT_1496351 [Imleria badia]
MAKPHMYEEIITTKSVSSDLYAETSSLSFIFRLPTETLEDIFIQQARDYHSDKGSHPTPTLPSWINVSYVCRHWRHIALNCATLWTYPFIMSPRWTEELLARSKQAPLTIYLNANHSDKISARSHFMEQVINHLERIQELRLHLWISDRQILSNLTSPPHHLQNLVIWAPNASSEWELPSVLFNGDTPALRTLELSRCPVAWYSFKLSGLKTLSLYHLPARFQQNTGDLLATLRCMPDLTHLHLQGALASAAGFLSSTTFHTFHKFNLPHLSCLLIGAPLSTVVAILSCVDIPLKTEIRLEFDLEGGSFFGDHAALCSLLAQRYTMSDDKEPAIQTIRSLVFYIWAGSSESAVLNCSALERDTLAYSISPLEWGCAIPLQIRFNFGKLMPVSITDRIISSICCSLPLTNVETIHAVKPPVSLAFWRKIFGHLPNLHYLKLSEGRMPDLASILSLYCQGDSDRGPDQVLAPLLEELELEDIGFAALVPEGLVMDPPTADLQCLFAALSSYQES